MKSSTILLLTLLLAIGAYGFEGHRKKREATAEKVLNTWVVEFHEEPEDLDDFAAQHSLTYGKAHSAFERHHIFHWDENNVAVLATGFKPEGVVNAVESHPQVKIARRQIGRQRFPKGGGTTPPDPLFPDQWHLQNTGSNSGVDAVAYADMNVLPAWFQGYRGSGVLVSVVDDGVEHAHPDFDTGRYVASASYDFNDDDSDPNPESSFDGHGTSCAGLVAAGDNGICGTGAAPEANFAGIRLIAGFFSDSDGSMALSYDRVNVDIYSNSWGPSDNGQLWETDGPLTDAVFDSGFLAGRGGRGSIFTWAAGNGGFVDNSNLDGYAKRRETIAVSAVDNRGIRSSYSEPGSNILIAAPSSGNGVGIVTTDLLGTAGYNGVLQSECTNGFGGTSAATPSAAGGIALMLEANPALGWRDVQWLLALTAAQNDVAGDGWVTSWGTNGAGLTVHDAYGHGLIDVGTAVNASLTWSNVGAATKFESAVDNTTLPIGSSESCRSITVSTVPAGHILEHVEVDLTATGNARDLTIRLQSPSGAFESTLMHSVSSVFLESSYEFDTGVTLSTVAFMGESPNGVWDLCLQDDYPGSADGSLIEWSLRFWHFDPAGSSLAGGISEIPSVRPDPECGNGITEPGEFCDDTVLPSASCTIDCQIICSGTCGNGVLEVCEICDGQPNCGDDCTILPSLDDCAFAEVLTRYDYGYEFDTTFATADGPVTCAAFQPPVGANHWYTLTPPTSGEFTVSTCDDESFIDSVIDVYEGSSCTNFTCLAGNDDDDECEIDPLLSTVTFDAVAGVDYLVRLSGWGGSGGEGILHVDFTGGAFCGDGEINNDETCDPAEDDDCRNDCTKCGDGVVNGSDECEAGEDCECEEGAGVNALLIAGVAAGVVVAVFGALFVSSVVTGANNSKADSTPASLNQN